MLSKHLLFFCLFLPFWLFAQTDRHNFTNYSTENGLPTNSIQHVYSDSYGFLWLASFDGLFRWDGYSFKKYQHDEADPASLENNIVYSLYEDSYRRLWIATVDGLCLYDRRRDNFIRCVLDSSRKVPVNSIAEDGRRQLWLGTSDGLCRYNYEKAKADWFRNEAEPDVIFCLTLDTENNLWIGTFNKGIKKFSPASRTFQTLPLTKSEQATLNGYRVRSLLTDHAGQIWMGTEDKGIVILNRNGQLQKQYSSLSGIPLGAQGTINCLYEDRSQTVWIGVRKDLLYCLKKGDEKPLPVDAKSLNNNHEKPASIAAVNEDRFGNTWFASSNSGLFQTNHHKNTFQNYLYGFSKTGTGSSGDVTCLYEDRNGLIWTGTNGDGVYRFDPARNGLLRKEIPGSSGIVTDIKGDKEGNLWIANWGSGVVRYNARTGEAEHFTHRPGDPNSLPFNDVKAVLPDDSLVWVGTHGEGLAAFDVKRSRFIHYRNNEVFPFAMHDPAWINHLFKDARKRLWISTYNGLFVFDGKKLRHFEHGSSVSSISSNSINMVTEDEEGNVWIATEAGLDRYVERGQTFARYTGKLPFPGAMKSLVFDKTGTLWMGSVNGLIAFDTRSERIKVYDKNDGLLSNSFFQKAALYSTAAALYFGSPKGLTVFRPAHLKPVVLPSYFYFTDLQIYTDREQQKGNNPPLERSLAFSDTVQLLPGQSYFSIGFETVNLYAPAKTRYGYRLEGLQEQWIEANDRKVFFMNLDPGRYALRVRYTDNNGEWQSAPKILTLIILPAWWQTWWFKILAVAIGVLGVIAFFYIRLFSVKRRNLFLKKEVQKRTRELSALNASLVEQNDKIRAQKEGLEVFNEEIQRQADKILNQQQHITAQNQVLETKVEELNALNETKDHFFSILAHDLKNPVFSLTEIADFIRDNFQKIDKRELRDYINGLHQSSQSVYELLVSLLNWSRTQMKNLQPAPVIVPLSGLVEKNKCLLQPQSGKKCIRIHSTVDSTHCVFADYDMIDAVIRNLMSNAIKFTDYNGEIRIDSTETNNTIVLSVTDNGTGMRPDQLERLFRIDKRSITAGTAGEKGTGLGLVISKEFVESNRGTISAESTPGKGSKFSVRLPSVNPSQWEADAASAQNTIPPAAFTLPLWETISTEKLLKIKGKKILIVDDNTEVRKYLRLIISDTFEIFEAANGKEALRLATEIVPAVIITDVLMPDVNGLELCQAVKGQTATSHIPVIVLTSRQDDSAQVAGYEAGADVYLTKPVKKEVLLQVVLNLLQNGERLRENIVATITDGHPFPSDESKLTKPDEALLSKLVALIEENIAEPTLDARFLSKEMAVSRTVLYSKIKILTGQTVHEFIKSIRLRKSLTFLLAEELSISQIAFETGFNSHSYFAKCFTKQYGMGPREYVNKRKGRTA